MKEINQKLNGTLINAEKNDLDLNIKLRVLRFNHPVYPLHPCKIKFLVLVLDKRYQESSESPSSNKVGAG